MVACGAVYLHKMNYCIDSMYWAGPATPASCRQKVAVSHSHAIVFVVVYRGCSPVGGFVLPLNQSHPLVTLYPVFHVSVDLTVLNSVTSMHNIHVQHCV